MLPSYSINFRSHPYKMLEFVVPSSLAKGFRSTLLPMFMGSEVDRKPLASEDIVRANNCNLMEKVNKVI